jgi:hypothetical protein
MQWAALTAWVLTAVGGVALLVHWIRHGGFGQKEGIRAGRLLSHLSIAVVGLGLWVGYLASDRHPLAWIAAGLLVVVALLGVSMLVISSRGRTTSLRTETPAEATFPFPIVVAHGVLGSTTLVLSVLAAAELAS